MISEQIDPLVRLRNEVWTMWNREHVLTGRGLARRPLSARRVHVKMTSHVAQCMYTISHTAQIEMYADFKSERRGTENISQCSQSERLCTENLFREHFARVVYREHIYERGLRHLDRLFDEVFRQPHRMSSLWGQPFLPHNFKGNKSRKILYLLHLCHCRKLSWPILFNSGKVAKQWNSSKLRIMIECDWWPFL